MPPSGLPPLPATPRRVAAIFLDRDKGNRSGANHNSSLADPATMNRPRREASAAKNRDGNWLPAARNRAEKVAGDAALREDHASLQLFMEPVKGGDGFS
jgi:hypothetical protein